MSQIFAGDAVANTATVTVTTTSETTAATGNFVNPPFGNAKASVLAQVALIVGTGTTTVGLRLRRNPNAENAQLVSLSGIQVTAGNTVLLGIQAIDQIPDGRPVQYAVTVQQAGATGNGSVPYAIVAVTLLSG